MDGLAALANSRASLEGKPYRFLPRVFIINDGKVTPPTFVGSITGWAQASLNRLAGIQVGDVVVNIRRPQDNLGFKKRYGDIYRLDRLPTGGVLKTVATDWTSLRGANPAWRTVHDTIERDSNEITNPLSADFGYGLLTAGTIADGTVIVIVDQGQAATQGPPANWNLNNLVPVIQVRRGGGWHSNPGWCSELNRLRFALGRRFNASDQTVQPGGFSFKASRIVSEPYMVGSPIAPTSTVDPDRAPLITGDFPMGSPLDSKDLEIWYTSGLQIRWKRAITPYISYAPDGALWRTGFSSQASGGKVSGTWVTTPFAVYNGAGTHYLGAPVNNLHFTLTGTLKNRANVRLGHFGASEFHYVIEFDGGDIGPGDWWLSYTLTVDETIGGDTGCHFDQIPDGKFYTSTLARPGGGFFDDFLTMNMDYPDSGTPTPALHTKLSLSRKSFAGETVVTTRLAGAAITADKPIINGENLGDAKYWGDVDGNPGPLERVAFIAKGGPIGVSSGLGDGTMMEPTGRLFAPHQFDYVPPAGELVAQGRPGIYKRVVSTQSRGPILFPNADGQHTDNVPRSALCRAYPTMRDPVPADKYVAFAAGQGYGQIIAISAIRPREDLSTIVTDLDALQVQVGCYRNDVFEVLATVQIPHGKASGKWEPAAGQAGIPVFEFYPLVVKCSADVMVYPLWFQANRNNGLGNGTLQEASFGTAVAPPIMANHYNDTVTLLNLIA
jgi:hypothetical protein